MLEKLRGKLAKLLLRREYEELQLARKGYIEGVKTSPAIAFRVQMKGYNPKDLDNMDDIEVMYDTEDGLNSFLADVHSLSNNKALQEIIKVLKRNQIMHTALETQNLDQVNFGRATVNGLCLLEEEIDRLVGIYTEKNEVEDKYDETEII